MQQNASQTRAALVVAHPGHELMVHGWLEIARPCVFVLTDGSGRSEQSRLSSTTRVLERAGASTGSLYGPLTDAAAYRSILNHEFEVFINCVRELTAAFVNQQIDFVAGDALEGYNPMHDVCRLVINAAVAVTRREHGREIANVDFSLINHSDAIAEPPNANAITLQLDEAALARKISVARGYAELAGEVSSALSKSSIEAFRVERLRPLDSDWAESTERPESSARRGDEKPFYEQYGEKQVAAGHYMQVLRYDEHIAPLADALRSHSEEGSRKRRSLEPS
jgi:hypothetical protein